MPMLDEILFALGCIALIALGAVGTMFIQWVLQNMCTWG